MRRKKMFFDKNEDNEVKIVDEVLSNRVTAKHLL